MTPCPVRRLFLVLFTIAALSARVSAGDADAPGVWPGVLEPRRQALIAAETAMRVLRMPVRPGESARQGEVLCEFDKTVAQAAVEAGRAKVRAQELLQGGTQSLFERRQATPAEAAKADGDLAQARLELAAAERDLAACGIAAPFDGKVVDIRVDESEWANRGSPVLLLVDDAVVRARFFLPEERFARLRVGDAVQVRVPAVDAVVPGVVSRIGVVFDPASRTVDVWADVDNNGDLLRAGMTALVQWPAHEGDR